MNHLVRTSFDVLGNGPEPCVEICDGVSVRIVVVDAKSSAEVDVMYDKSLTLKVFYDVVDSLALESIDLIDSCDL